MSNIFSPESLVNSETKPLTVALVDDTQTDRNIIRAQLEKNIPNITIIELPNGLEALSRIAQGGADHRE